MRVAAAGLEGVAGLRVQAHSLEVVDRFGGRTVLELWVDCEDERGDASTGGGDTQLGDQCEHRAVVLHAPNHWQMLLRERAGPSIGLAEVGAEDSDGHVPGDGGSGGRVESRDEQGGSGEAGAGGKACPASEKWSNVRSPASCSGSSSGLSSDAVAPRATEPMCSSGQSSQ